MLAKAHSACNVNTHKKNLKSCSLDVISRQDGSLSNNNNDFVRVSQHKSNENLSNFQNQMQKGPRLPVTTSLSSLDLLALERFNHPALYKGLHASTMLHKPKHVLLLHVARSPLS